MSSKTDGEDVSGAVLNQEAGADGSAHAHKVKIFYPFAQIRSWENHVRATRLPLSLTLCLGQWYWYGLDISRGVGVRVFQGEFLILEVSRGKGTAAKGAPSR